MTQPGIEPRSSGPLANTLLIRPMVNVDIPFVYYFIIGCPIHSALCRIEANSFVNYICLLFHYLRAFLISVADGFHGVGVTASLLKSSGVSSVFGRS